MTTIVNVVGSGDLGIELDLPALYADLALPYTEYDTSNYHGLYARVIEDGPLITVYRSGKYIITGSSGLEQLHSINNAFLDQLTGLGVIEEETHPGFSVVNVVSTAELGDDINLNALSIALGLENTEYEPEQFPGLVYRPQGVPAVTLVFASGKVVITGASSVETVTEAFQHLRTQIEEAQLS